MSRELLKRAADKLRNLYAPPSLVKEIDAYLAQPEDPVAWGIFRKSNMYDFSRTKPDAEFLGQMGDYAIPLYTSPPDQSAQIAELERQLREETESHTYVLEQYKLKLAALQAKREQLAWDELKRLSDECDIEWSSDTINFARAIEAAHEIG